MISLMQHLSVSINAIYEANKSSASTAKMKLNLTKIFENQKVTKGTNGKAVYSEETKQAIFAWLGSYVTPAYLALTYDHPELVWLSGAKYTIGYSVYTPWFGGRRNKYYNRS